MMNALGKDTRTYVVAGPAGNLEVLKSTPLAVERDAFGIVCHPHPLFGGTMHNKVVTTVAKAFQNLGLPTVRFNFRGVGKSEGSFDGGKGELEDLLAVINWLRQDYPQRALWLGGFSFGAYVAMQAALKLQYERLILVAPPVINFQMTTLPPLQRPWVLVQGEKDEVVSAEDVFTWVKTQMIQPAILRFPEAGHYFHGQLTELRTRVEEAIK